MARYPYRILKNAFDRVFRNDLNKNFEDIEADIKSQKNRVDNLINEVEQPSEVVDARVDADGHVYPVLKERLDTEQHNTETELLNHEDRIQQNSEDISVNAQKIYMTNQNLDNLISRIGNNEDLNTTQKETLILAINEVFTDVNNHKDDKNNPHNVTKSQVGLGNVDNVRQASKTEFDNHRLENANKAHGGAKGALVNLATSQSIPNRTYTKIAFDNVVYDTSDFFKSSQPTRLTVPSGISKIKIAANIEWGMSDSGYREVKIRKNDVPENHGLPEDRRQAMNRSNVNLSSSVIQVTEGDYFEILVYQDSGGALDIHGNYPTWFSIEVIE